MALFMSSCKIVLPRLRFFQYLSHASLEAILLPTCHGVEFCSPTRFGQSLTRTFATDATGGEPKKNHRSRRFPLIPLVCIVVGSVFGIRWYLNRDIQQNSFNGATEALSSGELIEPTSEAPSSDVNVVQDKDMSLPTSNILNSEGVLSQGSSEDTIPNKLELDDSIENSPVDDFTPLVYKDESKLAFPAHVPYLIVGAGSAAISAARAIRASDSHSSVLMIAGGCDSSHSTDPGITETNFSVPPPYLRPPLSKELWRRNKSRESKVLSTTGDIRRHSWLYYEADSFYLKPEELSAVAYGGVALLRNDPVVRLDPDTHTAILASGRSITYDRCLLATGGVPKRLSRLESCAATQTNLLSTGHVSYFRTLTDYKRLRDLADKFRKTGGKIAVFGGGFLGSELAVSLLTEPQHNHSDPTEANNEPAPSKLSVMHVFRESAPLGHILPPCLAAATGRYEAAKGSELWASSEIVNICTVPTPSAPSTPNIDARENEAHSSTGTVTAEQTSPHRIRLRIRCSDRSSDKVEEVDVDHVVFAVGIDANVQLAESAGLEVDFQNGGFLVNAEMEARAGIFVAGDAASYWDPVLSQRRRVEHLNFAEETGTIAGKNMVASLVGSINQNSCTPYEPVRYQYQSSFWSSLGPDLSWDAVGNIDSRNLLTRSFFISNTVTTSDQTLPSAEIGRLGRGIVFYLTPKDRRLVGILLWNLPEEFYSDKEYTSPSRLNMARHLLAERHIVNAETEAETLRQLVSYFDLSSELEQDYAEIKTYMENKKKEFLAQDNQSATDSHSSTNHVEAQ